LHGLGQSEEYTELTVEDLWEWFQVVEESLERTDVVTTDYDGELETLRTELKEYKRIVDGIVEDSQRAEQMLQMSQEEREALILERARLMGEEE